MGKSSALEKESGESEDIWLEFSVGYQAWNLPYLLKNV